MQPLFDFIIKTDNRYNNSIKVDGKDLILNTEITERDFEFVNRIGTVLHTPRLNPNGVKEGDKVIVHHNVFRRWFDVRGNERNSGSYLDEDKYICNPQQVFGFNDGSKWKATEGYCFVSPIENKDKWKAELEEAHKGVLEFKSKDLDIPLGTVVGFTKGSEYEFVIDGKKLYRVLSSQIYGFQEEEKGYN